MSRDLLNEIAGVLPGWLLWAGPVLAATSVAGIYLVFRLVVVESSLRTAARLDHWTKRARHVHAARIGAALSTVLLPGFGIVATIAFVGQLTVVPSRVVGMALVLIGLGAGLRLLSVVSRHIYGPPYEKRFQPTLGVLLGIAPFVLLIALGWIAPSEVTSWLIAPWLVLVLAVVRGWLRAPLLLLGTPFAYDADDRVATIVARAASRPGLDVTRVITFRSRQPNAFAFPWLGVLAFTTGLLDILDDDELEAITYHELAHLAEAPGLTRLRVSQLYSLVPIAALRPLAGSFGVVGPLVAFLFFAIVTEVVRRRSVSAERASDAAAVDAIHHSEVFGRALEKTYRIGMIPAVLRRATHGQLHERLEAAGLEPDFEPPRPPPRLRLLVAILCSFTLLVAAWFSPWMAYVITDDESLIPTQLSAVLPIYGTDALAWLASEAEFAERWRDAAVLYEAAAVVRSAEPYLRTEAVRSWAYAGDCDRAAASAERLDPAADADDRRISEELVEWCELTGGLQTSG